MAITLTRAPLIAGLALSLLASPLLTQAQDTEMTADAQQLLQDVRWKSESEVRAVLGDPQSVRGPIGTHASYQLWDYENFSVAFSNNHAFHLFSADSLQKIELEETR